MLIAGRWETIYYIYKKYTSIKNYNYIKEKMDVPPGCISSRTRHCCPTWWYILAENGHQQ